MRPAVSASSPDVVLVGPADDREVASVLGALEAAGARALILDLRPYPALLPLALDGDRPLWRGVDLRAARAVYLRSIHLRLPFFALAARAREGEPGHALLRRLEEEHEAERARQSFLASLILALERAGALVVNPVAALDQHFVKLDQLAILRAAGIPVPRTLATNDAALVRRLADEVGPIVVKPLAGGSLCRRVSREELDGPALEGICSGGAIFQAEAPGVNVRAYVVGGRVVAAVEIESEEVDYRAGASSLRPLDALTAPVAEACMRAARACGMTFTGIDLRVAGPDRFAVLELNPSPMFADLERGIGARPVSTALAELLLRAAGRA